jgi:hypothetical protein
MRKTLIAIICMTAVSFYGQTPMELELRERIRREGITPEEAERIVYKCVDKLVRMYKAEHDPLGDGFEYLELGCDAFPALYKILGDAEKMQDLYYAYEIAKAFWYIDGENPESKGEKEALEWTRRIVAVHTNSSAFYAGRYLAAKGNANDISLLRKHGYTGSADELEKRIASLPSVTPDTPQTGGAKPGTTSGAKQPSEEQPPPSPPANRTWLWGVALLTALAGGAVVWRKAKQK